MAEYTIDKIEYSGNVYKLQDNISGYIPEVSNFYSNSVTSTITHDFNSVNPGPFLGVETTTGGKSWVSVDCIDGLSLGSTIGITVSSNNDIKFSGTHIGVSSSGTIWAPTNNGDFTTKKYVDDSISAAAYTLPLAASGTRGGIQIGYSESGSNYAVKLSSEKAYVTVPWTDEKVKTTTYSADDTAYPIVFGSTTNTAVTEAKKAISDFAFGVNSSNYYTLTIGISGSAKGRIWINTGNGNSLNGTYLISSSTSSNTLTLPNATGTIALTSDIPTVPTISLNGSSTTSASFYAPTTAGTSGYYLQSNGSGAPTWAAVSGGLQGLVDGSASGSVRGVATAQEDSSYTMGTYALAEGFLSAAAGSFSHAEGHATLADGLGAHVEGWQTYADGDYTHAEGGSTTASGDYSHAQNYQTIAGYDYQTVIGKYNNNLSTNAFEIGNGDSNTASNAFEVTWTGTINVANDVNALGEIEDGSGNFLSDMTLITLNGTSKAGSSASFYAPTSAGTSGQVLQSSGSGAPTWVNSSGHILYGTTAPSASDGVDGDIYCVYSS